MKRLIILCAILLIVMVSGGSAAAETVTESPADASDAVLPATAAGQAPADQYGPGNEVVPLPPDQTGELIGSAGDAADQDFLPLPGASPAIAMPDSGAIAGLTEKPDAFTDGASAANIPSGRYDHYTLTPYPKRIGNGSTPAVISRTPGKVDLFYWTCDDDPETYCNLNTTAKYLGDTNPEYSWESKIEDKFRRFSPAVYSMNASHLGVFFVGASRNLYLLEWTGASGWQPSATTIFYNAANSTPGAVSRYNGNIELVYVDNTTKSLVYRNYSRTTNTWSAGEFITSTGAVTSEGASIVSVSSNSFIVLIRWTYDNHIWTRKWVEGTGWVGDWSNTGLTSYSYIGASTRNPPDIEGSTRKIDIITNGTTATDADWYWYVSDDGGSTWYPEPSTGTGPMDQSGGPFVGVSPHYNRVEFYDEYHAGMYKDAWRVAEYERVGIFRNGLWGLDYNGNFAWDVSDMAFNLGTTADIPVTGDWNGDGIQESGIFRNGLWGLDYNGNSAWDAGDKAFSLGTTGDTPIVGDWNGDGTSKAGIFRNGLWGLDYNGNFAWDAGDKAFNFGTTGDTPIVGDWYGDGTSKAGIFRNGLWGLDYYGNFAWDASDKAFNLGTTGDKPIVGDWYGDGTSKAGIFRNGLWGLDYNGNFAWDASDKALQHPNNITETPSFHEAKAESLELSDSAKETFARISERAREAFIEEQVERANLYNIPYKTYGENYYQLMVDIDKYEYLLGQAKDYCVDWDTSEYDVLALEQAIEDAEHNAYIADQELRSYFSATRGVEV